MRQAIDAEGQSYRGYLISKYLPLEELKSTLIELVHEKTGARVIQIANDDPENLFSLSFQTLPSSSNGVAHILEHTVLCGSEKFPIKDPFFAMTRRSLNTYMNALTGQDFTCYPAASQVEQDFYNLLEVYLDAVFHPQLKRLSFLQEGHRLAFAEPDNPASSLQIQGVVYNEMKGAMSGSDSRLWRHLFNLLMPDLPYAHNSGGDPKEIPTLTHEELIEFHKTFYHPSRCLFFFYGNLPLSKHLAFLERHKLLAIEKVPLLDPLPLQPRFNAPRYGEERYAIAPNEDPANKTIVALGFLTASISNQTELLALSLIDSLLTDTDVSLLKLALLKSGLCTIVESSIDLEMSEAPWVLVCKGCGPDAADKIFPLVRSVLEEIAAKGFDADAIEASIHQLEFQRMEIGGEGIPFGLSLFLRTALAKQHGADSESSLLIHSLFQELRDRLADPSYLSGLLKRYFLDNTHCVCLTLHPDPALEQREQEEEQQYLAQIRAHLSAEKIEELLTQEKQLAAYQETVEHQSIDCLPKITLKDVQEFAKDYPLKSDRQDSLHIFHHPCFTNRIVYADLSYDLPAIEHKDLSLLPFLTRCLTEIGCGGRSYADTLDLQQGAVGELTAGLSQYVQHADPSHSRPALTLRSKSLSRKLPILLELLRDFSCTANFKDTPRIKELLDEHATHLQNRLPKQALNYAIQLALSGFSASSALQQQWQGLPYFQSIIKLSQTFDRTLPDNLDRLYRIILGSPEPSLILSCSDEERNDMVRLLPSFAAALPVSDLKAWQAKIPLSPVHPQGRIIASPVAFTALAFPSITYRDPGSAELMVATDLFENVILHTEIREKGGAYGSGASYSPATGHFHFYSYRDPHLSRTYQSFRKAIDHIASGKFTERELEEAKLGILQDLDAPLPPGQRASAGYGWQRTGRTFERRHAYRKAILDASKQAVSSAVEKHLANQFEKGVFVTFAGEDLLKKEAEKLPFPLEILPVL